MEFGKGIRQFKTIREISFENDWQDSKVYERLKAYKIHYDKGYSNKGKQIIILYPEACRRLEMCIKLYELGIRTTVLSKMQDYEIEDLLNKMK